MSNLYEDVTAIMNKIKDLQSVSNLLSWDQETLMPKGSFVHRAEQLATIDSVLHEVKTSDNARRLADKLRNNRKESGYFVERIFSLFLKEHDKAVRLPEDLIKKLTYTKSYAIEKWKRAKSESQFEIFAPYFDQIIDLKIQIAECLGYKSHPYDALLDCYEPGATTSMLSALFSRICDKTISTFDKIRNTSRVTSVAFSRKKTSGARFDPAKQLELSKYVSERMAFDYMYGRFDRSVHPFTSAITNKDVRLTMKIDDSDLMVCLLSTIHESGHGLYEQGIDYQLHRTLAAEGASYGIHESQSLIWENMIARSREFWIWIMPELRRLFPDVYLRVDPDELYKDINAINLSFIRTESDELTYNLHIILRYEIEHALMSRSLKVKDVPEIWNHKMQSYLGICPEDHSAGCLQDIHWAAGEIGYFPSYTLGKLYAAMFWNQMNKEIDGINEIIIDGKFYTIRNWLKEKIHRYGKLESPEALLKSVCGCPLDEAVFFDYITSKLKDIYGITF